MHLEASPSPQNATQTVDVSQSRQCAQNSHAHLRAHENEEPGTRNEERPLPISALAAILGCTRSTIRHFADRLGLRFTTRRIGVRHKPAACLTPAQVAAITAEVERDAAAWSSSSSSSSSSPSNTPKPSQATPASTENEEPRTRNQELPERNLGHFYLLQLEPDHDPGRYKVGFSADVDGRLDDLRTVVPLAKLIATWPCHRSWERMAIISTSQNSEQLSQEVFRCDDLVNAIAHAERFFAAMPRLPSPDTFSPPQRIAPTSRTSTQPSTSPILPTPLPKPDSPPQPDPAHVSPTASPPSGSGSPPVPATTRDPAETTLTTPTGPTGPTRATALVESPP